jgi:hypothetical protein
LKQLFHIDNPADNQAKQILSLRIGEKHACFSVSNKGAAGLFEAAYFETEGWNENELAALLSENPVLNNSFYQVLIAYDYPQSIQVPVSAYRQEEGSGLLQSLYGYTADAAIITETIPAWQLNTIFSVPKEVLEWVTKKFPTAASWHQYSVSIRNMLAGDENGSLQIDFRKEDFTVMAARQSKLLLAQTYAYSTPEDVLYCLLKIIQQFSLSQEKTGIYLSGLIDKESSLYKELYQYFIQIELRDTEWQTGDCPAHFFTTLNDLARCES